MQIVAAIVALAKNLKLTVLAEGVETKDQLSFLRNLNCDAAQGYLFSRPVSSIEVSSLFQSASESRPGKFGQWDRWIFCLRAATMPRIRGQRVVCYLNNAKVEPIKNMAVKRPDDGGPD